MIVITFEPAFSGTAGMIQLDEPCATPDVVPFDQLTFTVPDPPEVVPLIEIGDELVELAGATTAIDNAEPSGGAGAGFGAGLGLGLGLDPVSTAAYNS